MNKWTAHWVFWLAPIFGGLLAGYLHKYILRRGPKARGKKVRESTSDGDSLDDLPTAALPTTTHDSKRDHHCTRIIRAHFTQVINANNFCADFSVTFLQAVVILNSLTKSVQFLKSYYICMHASEKLVDSDFLHSCIEFAYTILVYLLEELDVKKILFPYY